MKTLLLLFALTAATFISNAQSCTPGTNFADSTFGLWPSTATNFPPASIGCSYSTNINFNVPSTITDEIAAVIPEAAMLVGSPIQSFKITDVSGLPAGFSYACNISSCEYLGGSNGCANVYGTTSAPAGSYPVSIEVDITVLVSLFPGLPPIPITQSTSFDGYSIELGSAGNTTTSVTSCGSYTWNGTSYTSSGVYTGTTTNCVTQSLNLTITPAPAQPSGLSCWQTATLTTCVWDVTGTQPAQPTLACYQTATFNTTSCAWDVTGTQASQPTLACYQTTSFNNTTCVWDVTGTQPAQPTGLACYQTAAFNTTTCSWDVTGTQPVQPTLACYETATFNTTTCSWVISGPQAPQKMSYQAVIRNSNDSLLISTQVGMRVSLVQGAPSGTVVFSETQTATTNANGLVSLQIGMGTAVSGTFACIDWAAGPYYVKTETDLTGGTNYTIISSNELMSVPYALFSANGPTGALPPGTVAGEMNYWNGTAWVTVAPGLSLPGNQALTLSLCNGVPTWGPCPAVLPTVTTTAVSSIYNNITSGGAVTSDGGASLTAWGVCWSTSANPTLANSFLQNYVSSVGFSNLLSGLAANTTYYVRAYATNSSGTAYGNEVSFTTGNILFLTIGQSYQGGIIAYILQPDDSGYDATMQHGLIVAPSAQGIVQWGCQGTGISGADGTAIGTGAQNTIDIMNGCSTAVKAASLCGDLVLGGYNDWYLPSKDELHQLYINRVAIGGFAGNWHWSSSEYDNTDAWFQHFLGEGLTNGMKNHTAIVRAVRAF